MKNTPDIFPGDFRDLTGFAPNPWQTRLMRDLLRGNIPGFCDLPTGSGKSQIITLWLLAVAYSLEFPGDYARPPRRLVFIVDRRVLVDQATRLAEQLLKSLATAKTPRLAVIAASLRTAGAITHDIQEPFALSSLRGQHADNGAWHHDPARPAIVIGTVDMIGSRLLFSAYGGAGRSRRSLFAGLLSHDTLIVVDEAHLCAAFVDTLDGIEHAIGKHSTAARLMRLSATRVPARSRANSPSAHPLFSFDPASDLANGPDDMLARCWRAPKRLRLLAPSAAIEDLATQMAAVAVNIAAGRHAVAIFASTVKLAQAIAGILRVTHKISGEHQIALLTGEMRGAERDVFTSENPVFSRLQSRRVDRASFEEPAFLIATAAGEVGVDFDADHAVCDLTSLERMIQRFGRVNRRGDGNSTIVVVLAAPPAAANGKSGGAADHSYHALSKLPVEAESHDVSPEALHHLLRSGIVPDSAFEFQAPPPPLDSARLDDWAMTTFSAKEFPRPQVSYWLHGIVPDESLRTRFLWRIDLDELDGHPSNEDEDIAEMNAVEMAKTIPIQPREIAQVSTPRAVELLTKLASRAFSENTRIVLLDAAGRWSAPKLRAFTEDKKRLFVALLNHTVFLPTKLGGIDSDGHVNPSAPSRTGIDAVNPPDHPKWVRILLEATDAGITASALDSLPLPLLERPFASFNAATDAVCTHLKARLALLSGGPVGDASDGDDPVADDRPSAAEPTARRVAYVALPGTELDDDTEENLSSLAPRTCISLAEHHAEIIRVARRMTERLGLPIDIAEAIILAAERHDLGKNRDCWQHAVGNFEATPLAKSDHSRFDRRITAGYRHEFGSLVETLRNIDTGQDPALAAHPRRELVLHLIAAHHGHARPGFSRAFDPNELLSVTPRVAKEATLRFASLQRELGHWQLAYLEALVKCADALASAQPTAKTP